MSFMDKIKFWKKDEDDFNDFDLDEENLNKNENATQIEDEGIKKDFNQSHGIMSDDHLNDGHNNHFAGMDDSFPDGSNQMDGSNEVVESNGGVDLSNRRPSNLRADVPDQTNQNEFFSGSSHLKNNHEQINYQTLNMKLDSIRAYLDLINSKLDRIEQNNKKDSGFRYT